MIDSPFLSDEHHQLREIVRDFAMVAVNKIDKPEANPTRVRQQLTEFNLLPEEWGGDTVYADVSANQGTNLDHLLEMIALLAEIHDYRANPEAPASGNIIEARMDKGRGPVATRLVKRGTLRRGDALMAGKAFGRVRALVDDFGARRIPALLESLGDGRSLAEAYAAVVAREPDNLYALLGLARCDIAVDRWGEAQVHLRQAIRSNPDMATVWTLLATVEERLGHPKAGATGNNLSSSQSRQLKRFGTAPCWRERFLIPPTALRNLPTSPAICCHCYRCARKSRINPSAARLLHQSGLAHNQLQTAS